MAAPIQLNVISPDREVFAGAVERLVFPGADGLFGVHKGHAAMISLLAPGVLRFVEADGSEGTIAVSGGFVEVKDDRVSLVADAAELGKSIDLERATAAEKRARERLANRSTDGLDVARAELALQKALARMQAGGR